MRADREAAVVVEDAVGARGLVNRELAVARLADAAMPGLMIFSAETPVISQPSSECESLTTGAEMTS